MLRALPYSMVYISAFTVLAGVLLGGWFAWLTPVVVFGLLPLLDVLLGVDDGDPAEGETPSPAFDGLLYLWVPTQLAVLAAVLWQVGTAELSLLELAGLLVSTSLMTGGGGINIAHELMHRKESFPRAMAEVLMTATTYTHFCIEHVHGHHRNVATPLDPATSHLGESVYRYLPRTVVGGLRSAWRIEGTRNARRGVAVWSLGNRRLRYVLDVVAAYVLVGAVFGGAGVLFFAAQGAGAFLLLEVINYVEHYGLQRAQLASGRYERVQPRHSWNANYLVTNWWLFNLQRHADHHANASRPYYQLRAMADGPQLPAGYSAMVILALVPPLWHAVMDPRVRALRQSSERVAA